MKLAADHEILSVLGISAGILIFVIDRIPDGYSYIIPYCYGYIVIIFTIGLIWSLYQIFFSKSVFWFRFKWLSIIFLFLSPLIISILKIYAHSRNYLFFCAIISIYALSFSAYFTIDFIYKKVIIPRYNNLQT